MFATWESHKLLIKLFILCLWDCHGSDEPRNDAIVLNVRCMLFRQGGYALGREHIESRDDLSS